MSNRFILLLLAAVLLSCQGRDAERLHPISEFRSNFERPAQQFGTDCWWWLNNNVDEEAISRDLREMAAKGFYGAVVIDEGVAGKFGWNAVFVVAILFGLIGSAILLSYWKAPADGYAKAEEVMAELK